MNAAETLGKFIVKAWPHEDRFLNLIRKILGRGRTGGRRVRAFGEMVAVLWAQGRYGATVCLEDLWQQVCREESPSLFCAYPRMGLTQDTEASMREICEAHSRVFTE